jgi:hypothetical protein
MEGERFDMLARSLSRAATSRRRVLAGVALGGLLTTIGAPRVQATHFGCLDVGDHCKRARQCCSGRCKNHTCQAHNVGTCTATQNFCRTSTIDCGAGGNSCLCLRTTGGASFCAANGTSIECAKDRQCVAALGSAGAACVDFTGCSNAGSRCAAPCST